MNYVPSANRVRDHVEGTWATKTIIDVRRCLLDVQSKTHPFSNTTTPCSLHHLHLYPYSITSSFTYFCAQQNHINDFDRLLHRCFLSLLFSSNNKILHWRSLGWGWNTKTRKHIIIDLRFLLQLLSQLQSTIRRLWSSAIQHVTIVITPKLRLRKHHNIGHDNMTRWGLQRPSDKCTMGRNRWHV